MDVLPLCLTPGLQSVAEKARGGAAVASCGAHQSPALLCGICPGIFLPGNLGPAPLPLPPGHVIRSLGHAGKGLGNGLKMGCGGWCSGKHARRPEEGELLRRLLQIPEGRAALLQGQQVGCRIDLHHVPVRWLWRRQLKLRDNVVHPGLPRNKVSGRARTQVGSLQGTLHYRRQSLGGHASSPQTYLFLATQCPGQL